MQVQTPPLDHLNHPSPFNQSRSNHNNRKRSLSPLPCPSVQQVHNNNVNKRARYNVDSNNNNSGQNFTNEGSIDSNQAVNSIIMLVQERDALKEKNKVLKVVESTTKNLLSVLEVTNDGLKRRIDKLNRAHRDETLNLQQLLSQKRQEHCKKIEDLKEKAQKSNALQQELNEMKANNKMLQDRLQDYNDALCDFRKEREKLKKEAVQHQRERRNMETQHMKHEAEIAKLRNELNQVRTQNNELNQKNQKYSRKNKKLKKEMEELLGANNNLKQARDQLHGELDSYKGLSDEGVFVDSMNMKQLNKLEAKLISRHQEAMQSVGSAKEKLYECIACKDNPRNILFVGCGHCVICDECEAKLEHKKCSRCDAHYNAIQKIEL